MENEYARTILKRKAQERDEEAFGQVLESLVLASEDGKIRTVLKHCETLKIMYLEANRK